MMPPRSSATANAARKTLSPVGTLVLNTDSTPSENAMSVAMGIAIPRCMSASPGHSSQNTITGSNIPPHAPITGSMAFFIEDSSPTKISRLISSPTERKNSAIRKSFITCNSVMLCPWWLNRLKFPTEMLTGCCQKSKYHSFAAVFAHIRARMVQMMSSTLDDAYFLSMLLKL